MNIHDEEFKENLKKVLLEVQQLLHIADDPSEIKKRKEQIEELIGSIKKAYLNEEDEETKRKDELHAKYLSDTITNVNGTSEKWRKDPGGNILI
ncbi:hypothetical protein JOC85_003065 [Bacillus mesophilus]|uniref:Uncharacterized protein n=1 Tax=Bacillus mesophilus TaxID=1808955 RepID=A0A6M0Q9W9_9BACI|nr:hypothetical protein [Bacillus mesophilus]MBM7662258.1 hypothetical protein [Bacillus mesophilus]NEY73105.1 hypothetical protein [Bacillus mesophilus]